MHADGTRASLWAHYARPAAFLLVAAVSLYVFLPSLLSVFGSWRAFSQVDPQFAVLALGCEVASFVCLWQLDRIALRTRAWFPVATAELSGNAVGRIVPGGRRDGDGIHRLDAAPGGRRPR